MDQQIGEHEVCKTKYVVLASSKSGQGWFVGPYKVRFDVKHHVKSPAPHIWESLAFESAIEWLVMKSHNLSPNLNIPGSPFGESKKTGNGSYSLRPHSHKLIQDVWTDMNIKQYQISVICKIYLPIWLPHFFSESWLYLQDVAPTL